MLLHGGRFENYYSRSTVTHIICSNLTDAKVKIFQKERCSSGNVARLPACQVHSPDCSPSNFLFFCRHPKPFVRPEWITDSLKEHKLLSVRLCTACI